MNQFDRLIKILGITNIVNESREYHLIKSNESAFLIKSQHGHTMWHGSHSIGRICQYAVKLDGDFYYWSDKKKVEESGLLD